MKIEIWVEPHERHEALDAYRDRLTDQQVEEIENAPDGAMFRLQLWPGKASVLVVEEG